MKEFFETKSPYAYQDITARMVETVRKGYWKADAKTEKKLLEEFMNSVKDHGVGCSGNTCGNPRLMKYMAEQAKALGVPTPLIDNMQAAVEKSTGKQVSQAAKEVEDFVRQNESAPQQVSEQVPTKAPLEGYQMEVERKDMAPRQSSSASSPNEWSIAVVSLPLLVTLLMWRQRNRKRT
jgi:cobaltochelatase CobN